MAAWRLEKTSREGMLCGSFIRPNKTFSLVLKREASSPQKAANWAVVAAVGSEVLPMTEPEKGWEEGSL